VTPAATPRPELRLAELVAAMSLATDITLGQPMEDGLAVCLLATRLAEVLGLPEDELVEVYYCALLRHIGCTADMHVLAAAVGDDVSMRNAFVTVDLGRPVEMFAAMMRHVGRTYPLLDWSGSRSACTPTTPTGSWPARATSSRSAVSPRCTTSGWTARATSGGRRRRSSRRWRGCWPRPTPTTR
jgi:hypothetical protein